MQLDTKFLWIYWEITIVVAKELFAHTETKIKKCFLRYISTS